MPRKKTQAALNNIERTSILQCFPVGFLNIQSAFDVLNRAKS